MKNLWLAGVGALLLACGDPAESGPTAADAGSAGLAGAAAGAGGSAAGQGGLSGLGGSGATGPAPKIDSENCATEFALTPNECDAGHSLVLRCAAPNAAPSYKYCYGSEKAARGMIWCCEPAFADMCGDSCG